MILRSNASLAGRLSRVGVYGKAKTERRFGPDDNQPSDFHHYWRSCLALDEITARFWPGHHEDFAFLEECSRIVYHRIVYRLVLEK